ncbi:glycosyltransferase family 8 protein [Xylariaceae sp. FL0804]|nr:glycosyltransferase family 8 protein [Xylariaceae sp. FL0804]
MAPLWGSSWSSTWSSLAGYSPLQKTGEASAAGLASANPDSHLKPSLTQIMTSKRVRYTAFPLFAFAVLFFAFRNYDRLPSIETLRGGSAAAIAAAAAAAGGSKSDCLPAAVVPAYEESSVDWSQYAYTQYVTNAEYLCNSVMIFESLFRLGSRADRVMLYPENMMDPAETAPNSDEARLLVKARDTYNVKLVPISVQRRYGADATWAESFTKLLAFNQTQYQRVLNVDSDATVLQAMDELFLAPSCPVAMPRAYWLYPEERTMLSSQLMLVEPGAAEFARVARQVEASGRDDYDMEIVNQLYEASAMVLPHRPYDLLTGEFRGDDHRNYLGTTATTAATATDDDRADEDDYWDPAAVYSEAKYLHFSDWPVPKPWRAEALLEPALESNQPKCVTRRGGLEDCSARDLWRGFYADFKQRRKNICGSSASRKSRR